MGLGGEGGVGGGRGVWRKRGHDKWWNALTVVKSESVWIRTEVDLHFVTLN